MYPVTLLIGSLFSILDPNARNSPYNPTTQSHFQSVAPSYFAKKNNIFNIFFVKRGWAWFTLSYIFFLFSHPSTGPSGYQLSSKRLRGLIRFGMVTLWWIFVTQWFFGPPIIDRGFTLTGGFCELIDFGDTRSEYLEDKRFISTAVTCKAVGGQWKGGHDISGHVFLLVMGSMFLFEEVLHVALSREKEERTILTQDGAIKSADIDSNKRFSKEATGVWTLGSKFAVGVAIMSLYMLLMTATYFHTWFEKLTGLITALAGIFVVYFLPRAVPSLRAILGMPGL